MRGSAIGISAGVLALLTVLLAGQACPCTTFCLKNKGEWVFGRNLDWMVERGIVVVNKRSMSKATSPDSGAVEWISKYGSVTFNMYGREMPMGGMNEAGLVVENMWLQETEYPAPDARAGTSVLRWIQYQLDTSATVGDVIASDSRLRIGGEDGAPLHFLLCDRKGGCAVIEFLDGKMICRTGEDLPLPALANSTYDASLERFKAVAADGPASTARGAGGSLERFCKAAAMAGEYSPEKHGLPVDYAFATLDSVSNETTQWSIVYDPAGARVYFKTRSNSGVRFFDTRTFDFSCETPVKIMDMSAGKAGDVSGAFVDYTLEMNYEQIVHAFSNTGFLKELPEEVLRSIAAMPDLMRCVK